MIKKSIEEKYEVKLDAKYFADCTNLIIALEIVRRVVKWEKVDQKSKQIVLLLITREGKDFFDTVSPLFEELDLINDDIHIH